MQRKQSSLFPDWEEHSDIYCKQVKKKGKPRGVLDYWEPVFNSILRDVIGMGAQVYLSASGRELIFPPHTFLFVREGGPLPIWVLEFRQPAADKISRYECIRKLY